MLTELCCSYAFSLPLAHSLGCFSSSLTPKIFFIGCSLPATPPKCLWAPQASYCSNTLLTCWHLLRPDPTTTLPWPSLLLVLHPTVDSTPTTLPLHTLALSRPTRLQWSPNLIHNRVGECELWHCITKMVVVQILTCLMFMQQNGGCTMAQAHQILGNWQQGFWVWPAAPQLVRGTGQYLNR